MKKSIRLRARGFVPALSVLALACGTALAQSYDARVVPETLITATRMPQDPTLLPMGATVITAEEIRASGMTTASEAIRWLGGVVTRLDTTGGRNPVLDLRGFGETAGSNVVIMVDGVRQNEGDSSGASISWVPIDSIERIEIVRGSGAVVHGDGATAGMINIVTGRGMSEPGASASLAIGSMGVRDGRTELRTVSDNWRYQIYGAAYNTDNNRDNFKVQERNALARANWSEGDKAISIQFGMQSEQGGLPGGLSVAEFQANPHQSFKLQDHGKTDTANLLLSGEASVGDWRVGLDVNHRQVQSKGFYIADDYTSNSDTSSTRAGLKGWTNASAFGAKGRLLIGLDSQRWTQNNLLLGTGWGSNVQIDQSSDAVYARQELEWTAVGLKVHGGARHTVSYRQAKGDAIGSLDASNNSWELGLAKRVTGSSEIYTRVGTSFRLATSDEYSCSYLCPPNTLNLLNPQTSHDTELGYRQRTQSSNWTVRYYRSDLINEIGLGADYMTNMNFAPTRREGVEFEAKTQFSRSLAGGLQLAERRAVFRSGDYAGKTMPLVPQQSLTAKLTYQMSNTQQLMLLTQWVSDQKIAGDLANTCAQSIPSYGVTNIRYNMKVDEWWVSGQVANLFDRQYYDYRTRCNPSLRSIYPEPGRAFLISARRNF